MNLEFMCISTSTQIFILRRGYFWKKNQRNIWYGMSFFVGRFLGYFLTLLYERNSKYARKYLLSSQLILTKSKIIFWCVEKEVIWLPLIVPKYHFIKILWLYLIVINWGKFKVAKDFIKKFLCLDFHRFLLFRF